METLRTMPILEVVSIPRSLEFYASLGFGTNNVWGEPPSFAIVQRGAVTFGLFVPETQTPRPNEVWSAYFYVSDADALHDELVAAGLSPSAASDTFYGLREFQIADPDGHHIAFASELAATRTGPGLSAERGRG